MNTLEKTALVIIILLAILAYIMAWRAILQKDEDKLSIPFTQEALETYPAEKCIKGPLEGKPATLSDCGEKPLEYPLESDNFEVHRIRESIQK